MAEETAEENPVDQKGAWDAIRRSLQRCHRLGQSWNLLPTLYSSFNYPPESLNLSLYKPEYPLFSLQPRLCTMQLCGRQKVVQRKMVLL
jgi:hypothetical protein